MSKRTLDKLAWVLLMIGMFSGFCCIGAWAMEFVIISRISEVCCMAGIIGSMVLDSYIKKRYTKA